MNSLYLFDHKKPIVWDEITISGFKDLFNKIIDTKKSSGVSSIINNPDDLFDRCKQYGTQYKNGSWSFTSNIWNRSQSSSVIISDDKDLMKEHKQLMLRVLEQILCQPLIQVDSTLGSPGSKVAMKSRLYCDSQFPDLAYRWKTLNFPGDPENKPDAELFVIPHYLENPNVPGTDNMLRVIRFPDHNYSIVTCSSYHGEIKKAFLSHWINHVYKNGGTGEHASLREFTVNKSDGSKKRIVMGIWGLSGSGKSTHGLYVFNKDNSAKYKSLFNVDMLDLVIDQEVKNDDVIGLFDDSVFGSENGSWTKTEDLDEEQLAVYNSATSSNALHENTEFDDDGNPSFKGELFQYWGKFNQNARSILSLDDTGYFSGDVNSTAPMNMAIFISPGYFSDYAWLKITDSALATKILADGRTTVHPAQTRVGIGESKYESRYCNPFTMGASNSDHLIRFYDFINSRANSDSPLETYLINTTGRIGTDYSWSKASVNGKRIDIPKPKFKNIGTKIVPIGGTSPSIFETELFLIQSSREEVSYKPHPIWGDKVMVPVNVPGLSKKRLNELDPFNYRDLDEMKKLLRSQISSSKLALDVQSPDLPSEIYSSMDF